MEKGSSFTVRDLPRQERPRERLQKFGPEALSAQELLALVIGRGIPKKSVMNIAQELMAKFGNIKAISQATIEELSQIKDFMFQLTGKEFSNLKSQIVILSWGGLRRARPYAFTEQEERALN